MKDLLDNIICPDCNSGVHHKYELFSAKEVYYLSCKCNIINYPDNYLNHYFNFEKNSKGIIFTSPNYLEEAEALIKFDASKYKFNFFIDKFYRMHNVRIVFDKGLNINTLDAIHNYLNNSFSSKRLDSKNFISICLEILNYINKYTDNVIFE
jgi:hypothetical protein